MSMTEFVRVPYGDLYLLPNPRPADSISREKLEETSRTILSVGLLHPPLGRRDEAGKVGIYIGQRRFLAWGMARESVRLMGTEAVEDMESMPVGITDVDDHLMREQQWVENLQREDVHPRDEAMGYAELRDEYGYTLEAIARKIGKSDKHVGRRIALLGLPGFAWAAFDKESVSLYHLMLMATVPHPGSRERYAKEVLTGGRFGVAVMGRKEAEDHLHAHYMRSLSACGFDLADGVLVAEEWKDGVRVMGGACRGCPHLAKRGNHNICENVVCLDAKQEAMWRRSEAGAVASGRRVMDVSQTGAIFGDEDTGYAIRPGSGFIDLADHPDYEATGHYDGASMPTWGEMLEGCGAETIMARHWKTKRIHYILERAAAIEAIEAKLMMEQGDAFRSPFGNRPGAAKGRGEDRADRTGDRTDVDDVDEADDVGAAVVIESGGAAVRRAADAEDRDKLLEARDLRNGWIVDDVMSKCRSALPLGASIALVRMCAWQMVMISDDLEGFAGVFGVTAEQLRECADAVELWEVIGGPIELELGRRPEGCVAWVAGLLAISDLDTLDLDRAQGALGMCAALGVDAKRYDELAVTRVREGVVVLPEVAEVPVASGTTVVDAELRERARVMYVEEGMSRAAVAKATGLSPNTIGNWTKRDPAWKRVG